MIKIILLEIEVIILTILSFNTTNIDAASNKSTTQTISYQTSYKQKTYQKQATVYLPTNYDASKKHNIVYLMHGSTESGHDFYEDGNFKSILDKLSKSGKLTNTIVVFPTYYPNRDFVSSDYYKDRPLNNNFSKNELVKDLMPTVEKKYHTYADYINDKGFKESRDHRAFGGFSMGAITTWYVFENDLSYFHYFLPMAGDSWSVEADGGAIASDKTAKVLSQAVGNDPFNIMASVGSNDGTGGSMRPQIDAMWKLPQFNHKNLEYYVQKNGTHSPESIGIQFEHYANFLFKINS